VSGLRKETKRGLPGTSGEERKRHKEAPLAPQEEKKRGIKRPPWHLRRKRKEA